MGTKFTQIFYKRAKATGFNPNAPAPGKLEMHQAPSYTFKLVGLGFGCCRCQSSYDMVFRC